MALGIHSLFQFLAIYAFLPGGSIIQFLIARIEQFLNSPIQFYDYMKLINSIRNLRIEAICDQFAG